ncbi:MAG: NAD(P)H-hydrate epimerase, partial [Sphingomonadales bacterium]
MKIFSAEQIKAWDEYTMREEPISSEQLMERAAGRCFAWIVAQFPNQSSFTICCGKGNNGGDGLVIARLLAQQGKTISVYVLEFGYLGTPDFQLNLSRLHQFSQVSIRFVQTVDQLPVFDSAIPIIDALFGTGLNRGLEGLSADFIERINASGGVCISLDLPSGLFADRSSILHPVIKATHTLCLQSYKLAMMMAENDAYLG